MTLSLRESNAWMDLVLASIADGVIIVGEDLRILFCNDGFAKMIGRHHTSLVGSSLTRFLPVSLDKLRLPKDSVSEASSDRKDVRSLGEFHLPMAEGLRIVELKARMLDLKPWKSIIIIHDITERKQAEERLESLARFTIESPHPILRVTKVGKIVYANESSLPLLDAWGCRITENVPDHFRLAISEALAMGSPKTMEMADKEHIFLLILSPMVTSAYVNIYGIDITERKRTEEEMRKAKVFTDNIISSMADILIVVNADATIRTLNRAALELLGYEKKELTGQGCDKILINGEKDFFEDSRLEELVRNGGIANVDKIMVSKDQRRIPVLLSGSVMCDSKGRLQGIVFVAKDITDRKEVDRIHQINLRLQNANRDLEESKSVAQRRLIRERDA